ncbi:factor H binding protein domain-containing protein [Rodentibacter caecimuris]|uniref:factor H binding protein domain-containing protein n=2 Tax=Rodentibacter caecimuris TaxID=1796644 RepID=UPI0013A0AA4A|nr:factor H binding protein domain-containing protein [Rodentibacter heylii]QIA77743.1 transferrin-binding protein-like solute binding protein [Rodentibacter heylii]
MKKYLLSIILAGFLTACGSGGGAGTGTATTPDGTKIDLTNSPKGHVSAKTADGEFYGKNNNDSFYGLWINDAKTVKETRFQGTKATNLPSGSATYVGDAYWVSGMTGNPSRGGKTTLNVDFDQKSVDGKIEFSLLNDGRSQDITLHRTQLNGTEFKGEASTLLEKGTYQGGLFGNGAKEAAGIVDFNNDSYDTSFGGIRY